MESLGILMEVKNNVMIAIQTTMMTVWITAWRRHVEMGKPILKAQPHLKPAMMEMIVTIMIV